METPGQVELFPPPQFSADLAAGSRWTPAGDLGDGGDGLEALPVLVTCGGVYGGLEGPAGLYDMLARQAGELGLGGVLQLDTVSSAQ
jgi:hypothetical protein